jgi:hypothetical protein
MAGGLKVKGGGTIPADQPLLPIQYDTISGIILAETKALETLAESSLPSEDMADEVFGFDEAVSEVLYVMENRARNLVTMLADLRQKLNNRPKPVAPSEDGAKE